MNFKEIFESMDSSYKIEKKEKLNNVEFYYFDVNTDKYRIFVETYDNDVHAGFEYLDSFGEWDIDSIRNALTVKEVMRIFGTLKNILKHKTLKSIFIKTSNSKKTQTYHNAMRKLNDEFNFDHIYRKENSILATNDIKNYKPNFMYKNK